MNLISSDRHERRRTSGWTKLASVVLVLNILALLVLIVGLFAGWFRVSGDRLADGSYHVGLVFDSREADSDVTDTVNAASNLGETALSASELQTIDGRVERVDVAEQSLTLAGDGEDRTIAVTDATEFVDSEAASLAGIEAGDQLRVTVQEKDGRLFAVKVAEKTLKTE